MNWVLGLSLLFIATFCTAVGEGECAAALSDCAHPYEFCLSAVANAKIISKTARQIKYIPIYTSTTTTIKRAKKTLRITPIAPTKLIVKSTTIRVAKTITQIDQCSGLTYTCGKHTIPQGCADQACVPYLTTIVDTVYTKTKRYKTVSTVTQISTTITKKSTITPEITITSPTILTEDEVTTVTNCATAAPPARSCGNAGYQEARYTLSDTDVGNNLDPWDFNYYKSRLPNSNTTDNFVIGYIYSYYSVDGTYTQCENNYYNYRGYLFAPETGNYDWVIIDVDTAAYFWIGKVAYSGYNQSNSFLSANVGHGSYEQFGGSAKTHLKRGKFYPFRVAWACTSAYDYQSFGSNGRAFWLNVYKPSGALLLGQESAYGDGSYYPELHGYDGYELPVPKYTKYIVQYGCGADHKLAPPYPLFGSET